jgi:RNA polymerase subunit RPABC4/transcription elongation factor Spt4
MEVYGMDILTECEPPHLAKHLGIQVNGMKDLNVIV